MKAIWKGAIGLIKAKAKGKKITPPVLKVTHRRTDDLMAQLKASLKKAS